MLYLQILPVRIRLCTEIIARTRERYVARVVPTLIDSMGKGAMMKQPGNDTPGEFTFRPLSLRQEPNVD